MAFIVTLVSDWCRCINRHLVMDIHSAGNVSYEIYFVSPSRRNSDLYRATTDDGGHAGRNRRAAVSAHHARTIIEIGRKLESDTYIGKLEAGTSTSTAVEAGDSDDDFTNQECNVQG